MLLEALEAASRTAKTEDLEFRSPLTVEHLLPQDWEAHWPLPEDADPGAAKARRAAFLHRFGNLTLLTKALNPSLSNGPWSEKREAIRQHCLLALSLRAVAEEIWDEDAIEQRTAELFEMARRVWPRPTAA